MCGLLCASSTVLCVQNKEETVTDQTTTLVSINDKPMVIEQSNAKPVNENDGNLDTINMTVGEIQNDEPIIPNRRVVTYDQRQEGQYNIRADLENFMIVLIPQSPAEGLSILDLLTKSATKSNNFLKPNLNKKFRPKYRPQEPNQQNFNFINRQPSISLLSGNRGKISDLIEGRTPYKVDLSSGNDFGQIHTNQPVDVLPPPYPLAYQLLKPYHLEAEPNIVQAVKHQQQSYSNPDKIIKAIKFNYNPSDNLNQFRLSKTLNSQSYIDYSHDGLDDVFSKTIDLKLVDDDDGSQSSEEDNLDSNLLKKFDGDDIDENPSWEIKLIGSTENCGPGGKRDSYGICRFISSY